VSSCAFFRAAQFGNARGGNSICVNDYYYSLEEMAGFFEGN
jgi:hypothetical protein